MSIEIREERNDGTKFKMAPVAGVVCAVAGWSMCAAWKPDMQLFGVMAGGGLGYTAAILSLKTGFLLTAASCCITWFAWQAVPNTSSTDDGSRSAVSSETDFRKVPPLTRYYDLADVSAAQASVKRLGQLVDTNQNVPTEALKECERLIMRIGGVSRLMDEECSAICRRFISKGQLHAVLDQEGSFKNFKLKLDEA